jgi:hypothetical protein
MPTGRVFAILTADNRKAPVTSEDQIEAFRSIVAYSGTYRLEGNTLVTTVDVSADESWVGTELRRIVRIDGDRMEIETHPFVSPKASDGFDNQNLQSSLTWVKEPQ